MFKIKLHAKVENKSKVPSCVTREQVITVKVTNHVMPLFHCFNCPDCETLVLSIDQLNSGLVYRSVGSLVSVSPSVKQ